VRIAQNTPLLWVIRDELSMTGTKFGCGIGPPSYRLPGGRVSSVIGRWQYGPDGQLGIHAWDRGDNSESFWAQNEAMLEGDGQIVLDEGDFRSVMEAASKVVKHQYRVPFVLDRCR